MNPSVSERVSGHTSNGVKKPDGRPVLIAAHARELLNLRRLPAMLTIAQTAVLLNRGEHDIPVLVRAGLLKPLGDPPPNAVKFFATVEVLELAEDREALNRICSVLTNTGAARTWRGMLMADEYSDPPAFEMLVWQSQSCLSIRVSQYGVIGV